MHRTDKRRFCLGGGAETDLNAPLALFLAPGHLTPDCPDPIVRQIAQDRPYPNRNAPRCLEPSLDGAFMGTLNTLEA